MEVKKIKQIEQNLHLIEMPDRADESRRVIEQYMADSKTFGPLPVKAMVTPAFAAELLNRNKSNRVRQGYHVRRYSKAMQRGEWAFSGQTITVDSNGYLIDGQTRLMAGIEAGTPFPVLLVFGVPAVQDGVDARGVVDVGTPRSTAHYFQIKGLDKNDSYDLAKACSLLYTVMTGLSVTETAVGSVQQTLWNFFEHNRGLKSSLYIAKTARENHFGGNLAAILMAAHFMCSHMDREEATVFFSMVATAVEVPDVEHPALVLRRKLLELRGASRNQQISSQAKLAFCIKCWNAHRGGRAIKTLRFSKTERMPLPE